MGYDDWKTRSDMDDRHHRTGSRVVHRRYSVWRTCGEHGWAEHKQFDGERAVCVLCEHEAKQARLAAYRATRLQEQGK